MTMIPITYQCTSGLWALPCGQKSSFLAVIHYVHYFEVGETYKSKPEGVQRLEAWSYFAVGFAAEIKVKRTVEIYRSTEVYLISFLIYLYSSFPF